MTCFPEAAWSRKTSPGGAMSWPRGAGTGRVRSYQGQLAPARVISCCGFMGPTCCRCWWCWWVSQRKAAAARTWWSPRCPVREHKKRHQHPRAGTTSPMQSPPKKPTIRHGWILRPGKAIPPSPPPSCSHGYAPRPLQRKVSRLHVVGEVPEDFAPRRVEE